MQTRSARDAQQHLQLELALGEQINALLSATRALSERSAAHFHEGLQPAAFHIARWLHAFGPAKPSVIGKMRTLGLVASSPDPEDRRGVIVRLTESGEARIAGTMEERGSEFYARARDWSAEDLSQLVTLLQRFTAGSS